MQKVLQHHFVRLLPFAHRPNELHLDLHIERWRWSSGEGERERGERERRERERERERDTRGYEPFALHMALGFGRGREIESARARETDPVNGINMTALYFFTRRLRVSRNYIKVTHTQLASSPYRKPETCTTVEPIKICGR